jgi:hypothetical protein
VSLLGSEAPGLIGSAEHLLKRLESPLAFLMPRPLTAASLCANAAELPLQHVEELRQGRVHSRPYGCKIRCHIPELRGGDLSIPLHATDYVE